MSWQNRYILPWDGLRHDQIAAAAEHVFRSGAGLPLRRYKIETMTPAAVAVFFYFEAALERKWSLLGPPDELFAQYGVRDDEEAFVQIDFDHMPADPKLGLSAETAFEFYSNVSGNRVFSGVGIEIAGRIGRFFGVKCEPM